MNKRTRNTVLFLVGGFAISVPLIVLVTRAAAKKSTEKIIDGSMRQLFGLPPQAAPQRVMSNP